MAEVLTDSPRAVADKRTKRALLKAIRMALRVESAAVRHNTQTFNRSRYVAAAALPDYDALKDRTRAIKEHSIDHLPELLAQVEQSVRARGGHFYLAATAEDATRYIANVCSAAGTRLVVKGKSMTSEEVGLNHELEARGMEVAETDLAEFILQAADEQPSHIIAPAIHYSRERITELFHRVFKTDEPLDTGEDLTRFAREKLREKFLAADAGITGANMVAADGTLLLVESEANIRMTALLPPLHIAIAGIEKVIPTRADMAPFVELLAASGTGQPLTSYTSIIAPPLDAPVLDDPKRRREFHLVLVDNGRTKMRDDKLLREALYCIRCSACLNSCANFQTVGGHAFGGETYSGGIGGAWEAGTRSLENARFSELCTGCSRCVNQCPVRIDIPWLNSGLRERLNQHDAGKPAELLAEVTGSGDDGGASAQKLFFGRYDISGKWGSRLAPVSNWMNRLPGARAMLEATVGLDHRRHVAQFASPTLAEAAKKKSGRAKSVPVRGRVVLFPDIFTNYGAPLRGLAAMDVLCAAGVDVEVADVAPDGRAALSQGLITTATGQARECAKTLLPWLNDDRDIIVVEPSVLAMLRLDWRHFLPQDTFEKIRVRSFDPGEYLMKILDGDAGQIHAIFDAARHPGGTRIFYHSHCQQKTIGAAAPVEALLRATGFDVATSRVECCGMAGSFGYKKEYYELSMAVGEDLFAQVREAERDGERTLVASGTSCLEQLQAGMGRPTIHTMELLARTL
jgi:iron-sulfur cluster protein